jgi:hypothetical protein
MTADFSLQRNAFGRLVYIDANGQTHEQVVVVRAFALSAPDNGLALLSAEGKELLWIDTLSSLPATIQTVLQEELAQREFMPLITRIDSVSSYATPSTWQVTTDRGPTMLLLKSEDDIRRLSSTMDPGALLIADGQGMHFLIRDRNRLDAHSQKILKRFL